MILSWQIQTPAVVTFLILCNGCLTTAISNKLRFSPQFRCIYRSIVQALHVLWPRLFDEVRKLITQITAMPRFFFSSTCTVNVLPCHFYTQSHLIYLLFFVQHERSSVVWCHRFRVMSSVAVMLDFLLLPCFIFCRYCLAAA